MTESLPPVVAVSAGRIFEIGADRYLHPILNEEPSPRWLEDEPMRWIAVAQCGLEEVETLCKLCGLELPRQIVEVVRKPPGHPVVVRLEGFLFVSYSIGVGEATRRAVAICAPSIIMTFHEGERLLEQVSRDCQRERRLRSQAPLAVMLELIDSALHGLTTRAFRLRRELVTVTEEVEAGTRELRPEKFRVLKQEANELEIQFEDHLYCLTELAKYDSQAIEAEAIRHFVVRVQADIDRGLDAIGRLKSRIGDLHQFLVRQSDETTNRRLKILTVLSAIYLPPTLIAGIYGMNFERIPILGMNSGYALVLLIMIGIVAGQLVFFYRRGWFK